MDTNAMTPERARELFDYDPLTGILRWRVSTSPRAQAGAQAARKNRGYYQVQADGKSYKVHRLAWLIIHGEWPANDIDHINGVRADNRIANLRLATRSENLANRAISDRNSSGFKGVSLRPSGKWYASIKHKQRSISLGLFDTPEAAHAAYCVAATELFGPFATQWRTF